MTSSSLLSQQSTIQRRLPILLFMLTAASAIAPIQADHIPQPQLIPSEIWLRAGVLHAPPFASITAPREEDHQHHQYSGFQIDFLERLKMFALQKDNVTLHVNLSPSPTQYGDALDLVANDCHTTDDDNDDTTSMENTTNATKKDACHQFDLIVGDYYCNDERSMRVDFTPSWLRTTMSTAKLIVQEEKAQDSSSSRIGNSDITTLTQASQAGATVCVPDGTYLMSVVMEAFPLAHYLPCPSVGDCLTALHKQECALYADDELQLRYRVALDPTLEVTREQFNTQYLVWPLRDDLPSMTSRLLKKWMYAAVANATLDDLYFKYFKNQLCPIGTAGPQCELPCDPNHGTADAQGICVCISTRWTGGDCSIELLEDVNRLPTLLKGAAYGMLALNVSVIVGCGVWLYIYRQSAPVRVSQPFFLLLVLFGCLISSSAIVAMAHEDEAMYNNGNSNSTVYETACMALPWLYSVGFSVTFGTLFAKILRVYLMFTASSRQQQAQQRGLKKRPWWFSSTSSTNGSEDSSPISSTTNRRDAFVTFQETLFVIGVVLVIDMAILVAWTVLDPLHYERVILLTDNFGAPLESQGVCTAESWKIFASIIGVFHVCLLGIACRLCYCAKNIPSRFSESKYLAIAMMSNLQILVVGVPILVMLGGDSQASFFVRTVIIWMNDLAVVTLIFGNLIYRVHCDQLLDDHSDSITKAQMKRAVSRYTLAAAAGANNAPVAEAASPKSIPSFETTSHDLNEKSVTFLPPAPATRSVLRQKRRSLISSLSLGSNSSSSECGDELPSHCVKNKAPRAKTISWGLAYVSEAGEEDTVSIALRDTPCSIFERGSVDADTSDDSNNKDTNDGSDSNDNNGDRRSLTHGSFAQRFDSHQCQTAPNLPPRRPSVFIEENTTQMELAEDLLLEDLEAGSVSTNSDTSRSSECGSPPRPPVPSLFCSSSTAAPKMPTRRVSKCLGDGEEVPTANSFGSFAA